MKDSYIEIEKLVKNNEINNEEGVLFANIITDCIFIKDFESELFTPGNQFIFLQGYFYAKEISIDRIYYLSMIFCKTFVYEKETNIRSNDDIFNNWNGGSK